MTLVISGGTFYLCDIRRYIYDPISWIHLIQVMSVVSWLIMVLVISFLHPGRSYELEIETN